MVKITEEYLDQHRTESGAWTMSQFKALGVAWPPTSGWRARIVGQEIDENRAKAFEDGKNVFRPKTVRLKARLEIAVIEQRGKAVPDELRKLVGPSHTPPTNPKSIRRAERKAQRKKQKQLNAEHARKKNALRTAKTDRAPLPVKTFKAPKPPPDRREVTHIRGIDVRSDEFLGTYEWRSLRMKVLAKYGPKCMCCGATPDHGETMHVDHIKPRRTHPMLALSFENLQILCSTCNHGKGNWDQTDWRPVEDSVDPEVSAMIRNIAKYG